MHPFLLFVKSVFTDFFISNIRLMEVKCYEKGENAVKYSISNILVILENICKGNNAEAGMTWPVEILELLLVHRIYSIIGDGTYDLLKGIFKKEIKGCYAHQKLYLFSMSASNAFIVLVWGVLIQKRSIGNFGFVKENAIRSYLLGMLIGLLMFSVVYMISTLTGSISKSRVSGHKDIRIYVSFLLGFLVQGMGEEILCRGYFIGSFTRRYSVTAAVLIESTVFTANHFRNNGSSVLAMINMFGFGIFASLYYLCSKNIWGICAFHGVWNFVQGNIFGTKVSGTSFGPSLYITTAKKGKELINGGDYGLEGGIITSIAFTVGCIFFIMYLNNKEYCI